jgi:hypothetical protein
MDVTERKKVTICDCVTVSDSYFFHPYCIRKLCGNGQIRYNTDRKRHRFDRPGKY